MKTICVSGVSLLSMSVTAILALSVSGCGSQAGGSVDIDADDIGGVVRSENGPEAGVWVIAETTDLPTRLAKMVVTDDEGRYLIPDLPEGKYSVWVRGYGLIDSEKVSSTPGSLLDLEAVIAPTPQAAAQYYPATYWFSLLQIPGADEFPGTGPAGNGILPVMRSQQNWLAAIQDGCVVCHQIGSKFTREIPQGRGYKSSEEAWSMRTAMTGTTRYHLQGGDMKRMGATWGSSMSAGMSRFGRQRAAKMFGDWSDRIAAGEVPEAPPRPSGVERNMVVSVWDWGAGTFVHDVTVTDKRNPVVNQGGPVYGASQGSGLIPVFDPRTNKAWEVKVPGLDPETLPHDLGAQPHNPMMDQKGRVWVTLQAGEGKAHSFCTDESNPYARYFPMPDEPGRRFAMYDPSKGGDRATVIPSCFRNHHLNFGFDKDNTLFFSGDTKVLGWINTQLYDESNGSAEKSIGWCPLVIDTNGDGKITPDRNQWNRYGESIDPTKDSSIEGFLYGINVHPSDGSIWTVQFKNPSGGLIRTTLGSNPPETCISEYYQSPLKENGDFRGLSPRALDFDSKGVAWVSFATGQVASFDRSACKVKNGPTASGQHCPEGWKFYVAPGPKLKGSTNEGSAEYIYYTWVDRFNVLGLGEDVPIFPAYQGDALIALIPSTGEWVTIRIPYPMVVASRLLEGRIDDPKKGWKGRGLWSAHSNTATWHMEGGEGQSAKVYQVQMRPDPLAR